MDQHLTANRDAFRRIKATADGDEDRPVLMLNMNRYTDAAGFPDGAAYTSYVQWLDHAVGDAGGRVLWRSVVDELVIGCDHDDYHEILAVWYPSHEAFVELRHADGADKMFEGRSVCVEHASILALPADQDPMRPA